jgi:hypothetical protein
MQIVQPLDEKEVRDLLDHLSSGLENQPDQKASQMRSIWFLMAPVIMRLLQKEYKNLFASLRGTKLAKEPAGKNGLHAGDSRKPRGEQSSHIQKINRFLTVLLPG